MFTKNNFYWFSLLLRLGVGSWLLVLLPTVLPVDQSLPRIGIFSPVLAQSFDDQQTEADRLLKLGEQQIENGQTQAALATVQKELELRREINDEKNIWRSYVFLGFIYSRLSNYRRALELYQKALDASQLVNNRAGEGIVLNYFGKIYEGHAEYSKALDYYKRSQKIFLDIGKREDVGLALNNIGSIYESLGQYKKALTYYQQSVNIAREFSDQSSLAISLNNLGFIYHRLGEYPKALNFYQQVLDISRKIGDREILGLTLNNIGNIYKNRGEYSKALNHYEQYLEISYEVGNRDDTRVALNNIGELYNSLGEYQKALDYYKKSLKISQDIGHQEGIGATLNNIGLSYNYLGKHDEALYYYKQALEISRKIGNPQLAGNLLNNIGITYNYLDENHEALNHYKQALKIWNEIGDQRGTGNVLNNIGTIYYYRDNYDKALDFFEQALDINRETGDQEATAKTLGNIGGVWERQDQPELAITFLKQAVNLFEKLRNEIRTLEQDSQHEYTRKLENTYRVLADLLLDQGRTVEALLVLDLLKVQELQDFLKDVKGNQQTSQGIELLPQEKKILRGIQTNSKHNLNTYLNSSSVQALAQQLRQTAAKKNLQLAAYQDLQIRLSQLGQNSALFYPLVTENQLELILFMQNTPPKHYPVTVDKNKLEQTITKFRTQMQKGSNDIQQTAQQLYNWLVEPIKAELKQAKIQTLIYAPDGQMRYVPLAALHDGQQWLVEQYQINYLTTLSLTDLDSQSFQNPTIIAGAFTDFAGKVKVGDRSFTFGPIPAAREEVETLSKKFSSPQTLTGPDFTRGNLTTDLLNKYDIVHLATHGQLVSGNPEESFILLNNGEYITLREIKDWQLPNVGLVVLSACQTALGDQLGNGIEIIGFGYQLQQAQARASIATLWNINDVTTSDLMDLFYDRLQQGSLNPVDALRQAQITMIQSDKTAAEKDERLVAIESEEPTSDKQIQLSHPYYWAPFILIGNGL